MSQNYDAGTKIAKGTKVDITISLGFEDEPDGSGGYVGQVTIDEIPFDYQGDSGIIWLQLEQDGQKTTLLKDKKTYDNFPLPFYDIKSASGSNGTVTMYVGREVPSGTEVAVSENGVLVKYEEYGTVWSVAFVPVAE
jgi:hypothetical protein